MLALHYHLDYLAKKQPLEIKKGVESTP